MVINFYLYYYIVGLDEYSYWEKKKLNYIYEFLLIVQYNDIS